MRFKTPQRSYGNSGLELKYAAGKDIQCTKRNGDFRNGKIQYQMRQQQESRECSADAFNVGSNGESIFEDDVSVLPGESTPLQCIHDFSSMATSRTLCPYDCTRIRYPVPDSTVTEPFWDAEEDEEAARTRSQSNTWTGPQVSGDSVFNADSATPYLDGLTTADLDYLAIGLT
jgi:hypothetical protein